MSNFDADNIRAKNAFASVLLKLNIILDKEWGGVIWDWEVKT